MMSERGLFQGVGTIVRFNWPYFLIALVALGIGLVFVGRGGWVEVAGWVVMVGVVHFLVVSLAVSHWVYDRSDLYKWGWLGRVREGVEARKVVVCHSGFDEVSEALEDQFSGVEVRVLDHYDEELMPEPSISRARKVCPPREKTEAAGFDGWPTADGETDLVFGILAVHELRTVARRAGWFGEARRSLAPGGRVVVVESLRDVANFLAYGPGAFHCHSRRAWEASWVAGGLRCQESFSITPFVRVFVLTSDDDD